MDFFEHQDKARKKTVQLVLLFFVGITATAVAANLVCFLAYWAIDSQTNQYGVRYAWYDWWYSNLSQQVSLGILAVIAIGTLFRFIELAGGGRKVAQWSGAKPVSDFPTDSKVTTYINVSEEMAIAAGLSIPELYIMDKEQGINAFVAGYSADEAVMVVTRGAIEHLTRDQLQGVIGHEYSHILNGDMRLNIRLMAALAGLILLGQVGRFIFQSSLYSGSSRRNSEDSGKARMAIIALGAAIMLVGYIGVLVGRMIKAAVSRQREYLADASSVQFTRNPEGIAGALTEIKNLTEGSQLHHKHAEDMSHFCFGESVALSQSLSTHPPLAERIKRIDPTYTPKARAKQRKAEVADASIQRTAPDAFEATMAAASFAGQVGRVTPDHVAYAKKLYRHIPKQVNAWVHQSVGARSYLYCQIMLGSDESKRQSVVDEIKKLDPEVIEIVKQMWPFVAQMDEQLRLPVLQLAIPTLKRMSERMRLVFLDRLTQLANLDGRIDFIEWVTLTLTKLRLGVKVTSSRQRLDNKIERFKGDLEVVFFSLVELSPSKFESTVMLEKVFARFEISYVPSAQGQVNGNMLSEALSNLEQVSFMWRKNILQACADIVESDGRIELREYEALRVLSECFECPMPPLIMTTND